MQKIKSPERHLRCSACGHATRHRVIADRIQGDWREDLNLAPKAQTVDPIERPAMTAQPRALPADVQRTLSLAGVATVFVPGLDYQAYFMGKKETLGGRRILLVDVTVTNETLAEIAAWAEKELS